MRYINLDKLEELDDWPPGKLADGRQSPEKWRERLCKAEQELRNLPEGKTRSAIFKKYSWLWSDVKEHYRTLSDDKCWYCETSTHRMTGEIDHYRPKAGVEKNSHPGYWWLGFDWRNWRFVCKFCNSQSRDLETGIVGGKGNHFPLLDGEERRICAECDYDDLLDEGPQLLDPIERGDPQLLTFTRDGRPGPSEEDENSIGYQRAQASIKIYHLDHSRLNRERRNIYQRVREHVKDYQRYQKKWDMERDRSAYNIARKALTELGKMIAPSAQYSATARACLREYRRAEREWDWVDRLLTAS
jgi:uncharacterized protein (TIGR02646 family)